MLLSYVLLAAFAATGVVNDGQESKAFDFLGAAVIGATAVDLLTTEMALARPGLVEGNPMMRHRGVRTAVHIAVPVVVWKVTQRWHDRGHRRPALIIRVATVGLYGYATAHNIRQMNRR